MWAMLCHLSALVGLVIPSVGSVVGPLVVWLLKRHDHPLIDSNGKESLNFQISILIYFWGLMAIAVPTTFILIGFLLMGLAVVVGIFGLVMAVVASVKVSNGQSFRYPASIRFIS